MPRSARGPSNIGFAVPINGARDPAAAAGQRARVARLHRRHAARFDAGPAAFAAPAGAVGRWCRTSRTARRPSGRACEPTTSSSGSTGRGGDRRRTDSATLRHARRARRARLRRLRDGRRGADGQTGRTAGRSGSRRTGPIGRRCARRRPGQSMRGAARPDRAGPGPAVLRPVRIADESRAACSSRGSTTQCAARRRCRARSCSSRSIASRCRRWPTTSASSSAARPGDVLALYFYVPDVAQRQLKTVRSTSPQTTVR